MEDSYSVHDIGSIVLVLIQRDMDAVGYSKDLDALRDAVQLQQQMNQEIADFQRELDEFTVAKVCLVCVRQRRSLM